MGRVVTLATLITAAYLSLISSGCATAYIRKLETEKGALEGKILADLHTHPPKKKSLDTILDVLSSGIVGLAAINDNAEILRYEDVLAYPGVTELDPGRFAKVEYKGKTGYALKCQEILEETYHLLAVGIKEYIPKLDKPKDPQEPMERLRKYVELIHVQGGVAVLAHPCVTTNGGMIPFRKIKPEEEAGVREKYQEVDAVEVHNMQVANVFLVRMYSANTYAAELAHELGRLGIAVSDTLTWNPVLASGILIPADGLTYEIFKEYLLSGSFSTVQHPHNSFSFAWNNEDFARHHILRSLKRTVSSLPHYFCSLFLLCQKTTIYIYRF